MLIHEVILRMKDFCYLKSIGNAYSQKTSSQGCSLFSDVQVLPPSYCCSLGSMFTPRADSGLEHAWSRYKEELWGTLKQRTFRSKLWSAFLNQDEVYILCFFKNNSSNCLKSFRISTTVLSIGHVSSLKKKV